MISLLSRYIARSFLKSVGFIFLALAGIVLFFNLVSSGDDLRGNYGIGHAFVYTCMVLPTFVYQLLPIIGLIAAILGLGEMASKSELIVMRASGLSRFKIAMAVLRIAFVLAVGAMILNEVCGPWLNREASRYREFAQTGQVPSSTSGGWFHVGNDFIRVNDVASPTDLKDIVYFQFNGQHQLMTMETASEAIFHDATWQAQDVLTTNLHYNADHQLTGTSADHQPTATWAVGWTPSVFCAQQTGENPDQLSLSKLSQFIQCRKENQLAVGSSELTFWYRIFQPLQTLTMIFLAIPFAFGSLRNASLGLRLAVGGVIGFSFYLMNQYSGSVALVLQLPAVCGVLAPVVFFGFMGLFLIRKKF